VAPRRAPGRGAAALLAPLWILAACAQPAPAPEPAAAPVEAHEDAAPFVFAEEELDVPARPLEPIRPVYPPRLRELGVEGSVEARVVVWPDGSLQGATLVASDHPEFTESVRAALAEARFAPGLRRGEPVASSVTLRLHFRLER
jgi:TonB family protein